MLYVYLMVIFDISDTIQLEKVIQRWCSGPQKYCKHDFLVLIILRILLLIPPMLLITIMQAWIVNCQSMKLQIVNINYHKQNGLFQVKSIQLCGRFTSNIPQREGDFQIELHIGQLKFETHTPKWNFYCNSSTEGVCLSNWTAFWGYSI